MTAVERVVDALEAHGLAARGNSERGWVCQCPAHDDRVASLSISEGDEERALLYCHAGCSTGDIVAALGLEFRDLFAADQDQAGTTARRRQQSDRRTRTKPRSALPSQEQLDEWHGALIANGGVLARVSDLRGWTVDAIERLGLGHDGRRIVFPISNTEGQLVGVGRYLPGDRSNGEPKMRADAGSVRELWPSPERLDSSGPVWVVEGEPDSVSLASLGLAAVGVPGVASWRSEWASRFSGRDVIVCTDCDDQGRGLADRIANDLLLTAESVRVLDLDSKRDDGLDVGDLLREASHDGSEGPKALRSKLERMAENAEPRMTDWPVIASRVLPPFPVDALPRPVAAWVTATAEHTQTPLDLPALAALGVLSGAALGGAVVDCGSWDEELSLYLLPAMPSGDRKSTVLRAATQPLRELERERADDAGPRVRELRSRAEVLEIRARNLTKLIAKENVEPAERIEAQHDLEEVSEELESIGQPAVPRLLADDATPEALGGLLSKHGSIAVLAAESALIDNLAGRYSEGKANLHLVCAAYSGEPTTIDRKGHDPERLDRPLLTIALVVQPHVLKALITHPTARAQGLVARFAYALPETRLGRRKINARRVSRDAVEAWASVVRRVAKTADRTDTTTVEASSVRSVCVSAPVRIEITEVAGRLLSELQERIEPRLAPGCDLHEIADWAARHHGRVARIAGLLHLCEHAPNEPIGEDAMRSALQIGDYLLAHGTAALTEPDEKVRSVLRWLKKHEATEVTVRELHRGPFGGRGPVKQAETLAQTLEDLGALRALPRAESRPGRPASPAYAINPHLPELPLDAGDAPTPASTNGHEPLASPEEEELLERAKRLIGDPS